MTNGRFGSPSVGAEPRDQCAQLRRVEHRARRRRVGFALMPEDRAQRAAPLRDAQARERVVVRMRPRRRVERARFPRRDRRAADGRGDQTDRDDWDRERRGRARTTGPARLPRSPACPSAADRRPAPTSSCCRASARAGWRRCPAPPPSRGQPCSTGRRAGRAASRSARTSAARSRGRPAARARGESDDAERDEPPREFEGISTGWSERFVATCPVRRTRPVANALQRFPTHPAVGRAARYRPSVCGWREM